MMYPLEEFFDSQLAFRGLVFGKVAVLPCCHVAMLPCCQLDGLADGLVFCLFVCLFFL